MQKLYLFFISFFIGCNTIAQVNLDSLWNVWNDKSQADTNRLKAMQLIISNDFMKFKPDSAFYYSEKLYDYAELIGDKNWMAKALKNQALAKGKT